MKLLSYTGTRPGIAGIGNRLVRWRLSSPYSHSEVMFEPGDGVEYLMPDGSLEPDADGAYWCASASATDVMPNWGDKRCVRAGAKGGIRFKRIVIKPENWTVCPYQFDAAQVASWFYVHEGDLYDWRHILSYLGMMANVITHQDEYRFTCAEACAAAAGFNKAEVFDPHNLPIVVGRMNEILITHRQSLAMFK